MSKKLNVKIKPIGLLDLLAFKKLVPNRIKKIEDADTTAIEEPNINKLARALHPKRQLMVIKKVIEHNDKVKTYIIKKKDDLSPAYFRAGQYISFRLKIGDSEFTRPYSLSSSPAEALEGSYSVTIKESDDGFFSKWAMKNWKKGVEIEASEPEGNFYYEPIRDASTVIGICGGSGVTPFLSMAKAIAEGTEDFNLCLLYGSCAECDILFKEEFDKLQKSSGGKIKVVHILSEEENDKYEKGFITADLIKKYAPKKDKYSVFICGPQVMYDFVAKELKSIKLDNKFIRRELFGEVKCIDKVKGYPKAIKDKEFKLTVKTYDGTKEIKANASESLLVAMERAGIKAPSKCRSGECGFCRSKLISGDVFIPEDSDGRRAADKKFGFIHPCASYPLSDISLELPN